MGEVRVLVTQVHRSDTDAERQIARLLEMGAETLREPGCLQFEVFQSVTDPRRIALLEVWKAKADFDEHWRRRLSVDPEGIPKNLPAEFEFYEREIYVHENGIWMPLDQAKRCKSIMFA